MARRLGYTVSNRAVNNELIKLATDSQNTVNQAILNAVNNSWLVVAMIDDYTTIHSNHRPTSTKTSTFAPMCTIVCRIFPSIPAVPNQSVEKLHCPSGIDIESLDGNLTFSSLVKELTSILTMHTFSKSFSENMPDWIRDVFFDPEIVRHRLDVHPYQHSQNVKKMRSLTNLYLIEFTEHPLE